jgi:uncharacterized lipoprotein YmbA
MMRRYRARAILATGLTVCGLTGCSIKSETAPSRFYMLRPIQEEAAPTSAAAADGPTLLLGPLEIPAYLDRPQIVTRAPGAEVKLSEFERWAEPLRDNIARVLADNLATLVPAPRVSARRTIQPKDPDLRVAVELIRLDGSLGGNVVLDAQWSLFGEDPDRALETDRIRIERPTSGADYGSFVEALSLALADFSRALAAPIRRLVPR